MDEKIIIPVKEYPQWIDCHVFSKDSLGEYTFLYREPYQKKLIDMDTLNKLIRFDRTVKYLERYINVLDMLELNENVKRVILEVHNMLTENETVNL